MRKQVTYILELHDIEEQGTEFCFRKLKFITYFLILGRVIKNLEKPAYRMLECSLRTFSLSTFLLQFITQHISPTVNPFCFHDSLCTAIHPAYPPPTQFIRHADILHHALAFMCSGLHYSTQPSFHTFLYTARIGIYIGQTP